jgi:hypothetical protein
VRGELAGWLVLAVRHVRTIGLVATAPDRSLDHGYRFVPLLTDGPIAVAMDASLEPPYAHRAATELVATAALPVVYCGRVRVEVDRSPI